MSLSNQEIYDISARHLLTQKQRAVRERDDSGMCLYRSPGGLKCAVGALIKDEHYHPALEGKDPSLRSVQLALLASGVDTQGRVALYLLTELQRIHDRSPVSDWLSALAQLARVQMLSSDVLKEFL